MANVVFVGAYAYAAEVLAAMPEPPSVVVTTRRPDLPRWQHIDGGEDTWTNGDVASAVMSLTRYDGPPDLIVVAGWRRIVPAWIVNRYPTVGFHSAKLPEYPGRAPVANAILRGDATLTNTMLYLDAGVDTGDIIAERTFPIGQDPDAIYRDIGRTSAEMLRQHWDALLDGTAPRTPQDITKRGPETPADAWQRIAPVPQWVEALG